MSSAKWQPFCLSFNVLNWNKACCIFLITIWQADEWHNFASLPSCRESVINPVGHVHLVAIAGTTILVPCHVVKTLQLIRRSGTRRWNLRVPDLQMSYSDLTLKIGHQDSSPSNGCNGQMPCWLRILTSMAGKIKSSVVPWICVLAVDKFDTSVIFFNVLKICLYETYQAINHCRWL